jgi:putative transposase
MRTPLFTTRQHVDLVYGQILRGAGEQGAAILAYCFMPDHLHLLIEMRADVSDCLRFISRAKQYSGFHFQRTFGQRLWQRYGYEHVLWDDRPVLLIARYILENPLRAGLVESPQDYGFSGSDVYDIREILEASWSG